VSFTLVIAASSRKCVRGKRFVLGGKAGKAPITGQEGLSRNGV
jgi:hypothetical protein